MASFLSRLATDYVIGSPAVKSTLLRTIDRQAPRHGLSVSFVTRLVSGIVGQAAARLARACCDDLSVRTNNDGLRRPTLTSSGRES